MAVPTSVIIVGSGVFGLSTAYAMSKDARFTDTRITLVDPWNFEPLSDNISVRNERAANADTSRVIRRDYSHESYADLASEARRHWKAEFGENNRYVEQRLLFSAEGCSLNRPKKPLETINYIKDAYEISCKMTPGGKDGLKVVDSLLAIRAELSKPSERSSTTSVEQSKDIQTLRGYISDDCGWANAGASIAWLRQEVSRLNRVDFRTGEVEGLMFKSGDQEVAGVTLKDGVKLNADLTIIAAGSQSPHIIGIPNLCDVYSDVVAYIQLSEQECHELRRRNWPLIVNAHRGVFLLGPDHDNRLKLGHFSYSGIVDVLRSAGMEVNPRTGMSKSSRAQQWNDASFGWGGDVALSELGDVVDATSDDMHKTLADYRIFLLELLGPNALEGVPALDKVKVDGLLNSIAIRPFIKVRKCWYTDTPSLDFIVDYHPSYAKSLFVATGGGDHAFKFLPIIGEKIIAIALHHRGLASKVGTSTRPSVEELSHLWKFPIDLLEADLT